MVILPEIVQLFTSELVADSSKQVCIMLKSAFLCISKVFPIRTGRPAWGNEGVFVIRFGDSSPPAGCAV